MDGINGKPTSMLIDRQAESRCPQDEDNLVFMSGEKFEKWLERHSGKRKKIISQWSKE